MNMLRSPTNHRVAVIGAGISGLSAAYHLISRPGNEVVLLESSARVGGQIQTVEADGRIYEGGPDQFLTHKPAALELCRRLEMQDEIVQVGGAGLRAHVLHRGRPRALPGDMSMLVPGRLRELLTSPVFSLRGKLRIVCERWIPAAKQPAADESLTSFITRRFGSEMLERVAEPIIAGIFTADADRMSTEMTLSRLRQMEANHGSLTGARRRAARPSVGRSEHGQGGAGFVTLRRGLGSLVQRLERALPEGTLHKNDAVERASYRADSGWEILLASGKRLHVDFLILACPAFAAARIVRDQDPDLAAELDGLEYSSCATVSLVYPQSAAGSPLEGYGFFVPRAERLPLLACSYVSRKFAGRTAENELMLRAFVGGARDPGRLELDDDTLARQTQETLAPILRLRGQPTEIRVFRYPRAMPQFPVGYRSRVDRIGQRIAAQTGLALCGGALGAVGLPDCISSGELAAKSALQDRRTAWPRSRTAGSRG